MVLAWLGAQTRMRTAADTPVQKLLGVISETHGTISLAIALILFEKNCFSNLRNALNVPGLNMKYYTGPGVYCYAICCASGLIRGLMHYLTPLPGTGDCAGEYVRYDPSKETYEESSGDIEIEIPKAPDVGDSKL
jgi:hypothetical protein